MSIHMKFVFFLYILVHYVIQCQEETSRIVSTSVGDIQGSLDINRGYYKFLGIPYGYVSETNPFGESTPYPQFDGVFVANNDTAICPQKQNGEIMGVRDCLNLHVYVPDTATASSRLPVIIWIHGGYFMRGRFSEAFYGPKYLVRHDIVFVAVNYRTGPFGFMCLGVNEVPGNQGLKDQQLAMEWIERNIEAFGGNPNEITLAGNSAGAHSIDLHLLSNRRNVYNKVIMQSGSSLVGTMLYEPDVEAPIKIANHLGLEPNTTLEALSLLANIDVHSVISAATELKIQFKPCVEHEFEGSEAFISHSWINAEVPKVSDMPVLLGINQYERMSYHINQTIEHFQDLDIFLTHLNHTFDFNDLNADDNRLERMADYMRRFYIGDSATSQNVLWPIINFDSDFMYNHPIQRSVKKYLISGAGNIFYYMFMYSGERNQRLDMNNVTIQGTAHSDDLTYLFEMSHLPDEVSPADQQVIDRMTAMWTNFAKYGDPTPEITALLPLRWTPLTEEIYHYLRIESELSMDRRPLNKRMAFFDLFYKSNVEYQKTYDQYKCCENGNDAATINPASLTTLISALLLLVFLGK